MLYESENESLAGTQSNMMQWLENLPKQFLAYFPILERFRWRELLLSYSHGHRNQMGMEWWVYDTRDKADVLTEIHVGTPVRPTQFPHGLSSDLNLGHCDEEPETKPLSHGKCLKPYHY